MTPDLRQRIEFHVQQDMVLTETLHDVVGTLTAHQEDKKNFSIRPEDIEDTHRALLTQQCQLKEQILVSLRHLPAHEQSLVLQPYVDLYENETTSYPQRDFLYSFADVRCAELQLVRTQTFALFKRAMRALQVMREIGPSEQDLKIRLSAAKQFDAVIASQQRVVTLSEYAQRLMLAIADLEKSAGLHADDDPAWVIGKSLIGRLIVLFDSFAFRASTHTDLSMTANSRKPHQDIQLMSLLAFAMSEGLPERISHESDVDARLRLISQMMSSIAHRLEEKTPELLASAPDALRESAAQFIQDAIEAAHRASAGSLSFARLVDEQFLKRPSTATKKENAKETPRKATKVMRKRRRPASPQAGSSRDSAAQRSMQRPLVATKVSQDQANTEQRPAPQPPVHHWLQQCEAQYSTHLAKLERLLRQAHQQDEPDYLSQRCAELRQGLEESTALLQRRCAWLGSESETPPTAQTLDQRAALATARQRHHALLTRLNQPRLSTSWLIKNHPAPKASHWHKLAQLGQLAPLSRPTLLPALGETLFRLKIQPKPETDERGQIQHFPPVWLHTHVRAHFTEPEALFTVDYRQVSRAHLKSDHQSLRGQRWMQQHLIEHGMTEFVHHSRALTQEEFNALRHYTDSSVAPSPQLS